MTAVSKNVYFDALHDIVNNYNNTYHRTIKMSKVILLLNTRKNLMQEILNTKYVIT